jgi:hypothetical protein
LLIEEQRTNLLTYSSDFSNAVWVKSADVTVSAGVTAPDGGASQQFTVTASTTIGIRQEVAVAATSATYTIYAKQGSGATDLNKFILRNTTTATNLVNISIDYSTGVVTGDGGSATSAGNGWWRIQLAAATGITSGNLIRVFAGGVGGSETAGEFAYFWGAQLEAGAFATSYIPSVASQVTRAADSASMIGNNFARWYNQTEGSLFADLNSGVTSAALDGNGFSRGAACLHDGTNNNRIRFGVNVTGATLIANNVTQADYGFAFSAAANTNYKIAFGYKVNSFNLANNNVLATEDTSGVVSVGINQMAIGNSSTAGNGVLNGTIKKIAFYPKRLANTELQSITS